MNKVKITVKRMARYDDLIEEYENPIEHTCDLKTGQVFIACGYQKPKDLCDSAWDSMAPFVKVLAEGGGNFYDGWMKNTRSAMISCNDGFRPVSFLLEALDEDADLPLTEVVAALIFRDGRFMICQRPKEKSCGLLWEFVGGKVEPGESKEEALKREVKEEIDASLEVGKVFFDVIHQYPDIRVHLTLYLATLTDEPKLIEHNDIRWIYPSEISLYDFCPADKDILEKIQKEFSE